MRPLLWFGRLCVLMAACAGAFSAFAGGFWMPGRGVGPLGRGGAVVALPGDLNGIWYNPATLAFLDGHQFLFDATLTHLSAEHTRAPTTSRNGDTISFAAVQNEASPIPIPQLLFGTQMFDGSPVRIAVGVFAPSAAPYTFPERGPQRYTQIDNSKSLILYQELAVAWQIHERVSIGAGLQNVSAVVDTTVMGSAYVGLWGEPEDQDQDALFNIRAADFISITGNFGVWAEPLDGLSLGLSAQLPVEVKDDQAKLKTRLPSHYAFDNAKVEGDTLGVSVTLPWIIRGGIRYGIAGVFDVEVDAYAELWSTLKEIVTDPQNIRVTGAPLVGDIVLGPLNVVRDYRDIIGISVGGSWWVLPDVLMLQAGFMYEQGAVPDHTFSLFQLDSDKYAPTLGAQWRFAQGWALDAAYSHIFHAPREITQSEVKQINPAYEEGATVVANGSYTARHDLFGLGLRFGF